MFKPAGAQTSPKMRHAQRRVFGWRPSTQTWLIVLFLLAGTAVVFQTTAASWFSAFNQAAFVEQYLATVQDLQERGEAEFTDATEYNAAVMGSSVLLAAHTRMPAATDVGGASQVESYKNSLNINEAGLMGRLQVPAVDIDLPIYHGASDDTLAKGVGHVEGSHLPIGGDNTNAVLTAYRGLPSATMFNRLDELTEGDQILVGTYGAVMNYKITDVSSVSAAQSAELVADQKADHITLVTSSPLVEDAPRIVVTAERDLPLSSADYAKAVETPQGAGFPGWLLFLGAAYAAIGLYLWRAGYTDARNRRIRKVQKVHAKAEKSATS
ncbi:class C sortase [Micrococcoides hystricis]|uniref:Class C sortase n=1 Tax=Micrococcoides hystricis TaxID=1572761 RepID=A0ABV6PAS0_9MICC